MDEVTAVGGALDLAIFGAICMAVAIVGLPSIGSASLLVTASGFWFLSAALWDYRGMAGDRGGST